MAQKTQGDHKRRINR